MNIPLYQIDAFTSTPFAGNPAAVCPLERWLDDELLQAIAAENNLSETAFFVPRSDHYTLRWFTPTTEVELCGHATLAAAFVIFDELAPALQSVAFETASGRLVVQRDGDLLALDFPTLAPEACEIPQTLLEGLGATPRAVLAAMDYLAVYDSEDQVRALRPNMERLCQLDRRGVIATAPGVRADFVSRFFAPASGIPEDPVTGSAHCTLTPYWAARLSRPRLHALQLSPRGGELFCEDRGERTIIAGRAAKYLYGTIVL
jgi:PhzF family phenazine biosynthesis protein